jgi:hypothetical protein
MDARYKTIELNKIHLIQSHDKTTILIEFTQEQYVYDEEEYAGMNAYECYILDAEMESTVRAIYYYNFTDGTQFLKYYENHDDDTKTTVIIYRILPMEKNDTIEETLVKADKEDNGLSMGDIC